MTLAKYEYEASEIEQGYNRRTLHIDIGKKTFSEKAVNEKMKETFVGGKGFDLWLLWNSIPQKTKWNDPENEVVISSGPLGGTPMYPGSGKSIVVSISPTTGSVIDSNVGGYFGPYLKYSGFDAMEIQGKSEKPVVIIIDGDENTIEIVDGADLPENSYERTQVLTKKYGGDNPRSISVVTAGPGAKNTWWGCLNFSWYDAPRKVARYKQAGRGGIGTVFMDKNIAAIVAKVSKPMRLENNAPAEPEKVKEAGKYHSKEIRTLDPKQNEMRRVGTTHIVDIMNDYDLLPTKNYKFGSHKDAENIGREAYRARFDKGFDGCWVGCTVACSHCIKNHEVKTGPMKGEKVWVDGPEYETIAGMGSNLGIFDADWIAEGNFYCDAYGLDTISVGTGIAFVMECYENGLITKEHTGGLELNFGNKEAVMELIHQMARGEGFGVIVGKGIRYMKGYFAEHFGADETFMQDIGMESKGLEFSEYITKESLAQQGGYGLALKGPQHDEAWLIFLDMVHGYLPSFEDKAEALHWFPMWRTWFGLNGLCKLPWNDIVPEDNSETEEPAKVMKHVKSYAKYFSGITGRNVGPDDLIKMSEGVYNFQRIFNLRQGYGTREHDSIPYRAVGPVTVEEYESRWERYDEQLKELHDYDPEGKTTQEKLDYLRKVREEKYETLTDAVYKRRGWTGNGIPTIAKVKELGIDFPEVIELITPHQE